MLKKVDIPALPDLRIHPGILQHSGGFDIGGPGSGTPQQPGRDRVNRRRGRVIEAHHRPATILEVVQLGTGDNRLRVINPLLEQILTQLLRRCAEDFFVVASRAGQFLYEHDRAVGHAVALASTEFTIGLRRLGDTLGFEIGKLIVATRRGYRFGARFRRLHELSLGYQLTRQFRRVAVG